MEHEGKAKGGAARMASMTPEQRKENAKLAAEAKAKRKLLAEATHVGDIQFGDVYISCAVLSDGTRVFTESGISDAMLGTRSGASKRMKKQMSEEGAQVPVFLASKQLNPFIIKHFSDGPPTQIEYLYKGKTQKGFEASILPKTCEVWLDARASGALLQSQVDKAMKAELMMRGLARIGVVALIDEATGYQDEREKNALAKILEKFVAKELQPWMKTFPKDYYEQLFRLYGIAYPPQGNPSWKPQFFGHVTNNVVYERLAPEILPELKSLASKAEKKVKLHQWLSSDIGHPKLREHLASIVTLLKISTSKEQFHQLVDQIHPKLGQNKSLDL